MFTLTRQHWTRRGRFAEACSLISAELAFSFLGDAQEKSDVGQPALYLLSGVTGQIHHVDAPDLAKVDAVET
ncbi:hypothetical protein KIN_32630 [Litoreibacter roseus]|uniref:Uncharacterized protein n=1 Tax=Litoreibacter roseus TaxID=2601869 RepID=A0A6N6JLA8_9RHOB|nr:hypothetical protein KIN_32630 [Litoreibacter roseus]